MTRECIECGAGFEVPYPRSNPQRFCSRPCAARNQMRGRANPNYNGGLSAWPNGRAVICCSDGSVVTFARAVAEADLGRPLRDDEVVHHVNGDVTDDRPENLRVLTRAEHIDLHRADLEAGKVAA